ncbi:hypothetical protein NDU88_004939 [Pleurodeles waltl]|uniref:Secreted protein n=1 Tax=Pleurodeles waltl TaxID=8319 RepID=A0AAV7NQS3_PLEWA|nr:hypothetical protein NDU88_004939 [Pleurodeles waltl]
MPWRRVLSMLWKRVVSANTIRSRMCACHFKQRLDTLPGCLEESPSVVLETRACRRTPTQFSVVLETHLRLALGARAQFQFLRSIKPKIVITIILADHSPAILEMRSSSSVPNGVPDRERPVSRNQGKRRHPVEASDT